MAAPRSRASGRTRPTIPLPTRDIATVPAAPIAINSNGVHERRTSTSASVHTTVMTVIQTGPPRSVNTVTAWFSHGVLRADIQASTGPSIRLSPSRSAIAS